MSDQIENVDDELTEEEKAALAFDDSDEKTAVFDPDAVPDPAAEPAPAAAEVDPDLPPVAEPEAAPEVPAAEATPEPEAKPEPAKQEVAPTHAPILVVQAPEDAQAKLAEFAKKRDEVFQKFDDGEITNAEYNKQLADLNDERLGILLHIERANLAQQLESQRIQNQWVNDCNTFLAQHPEYSDQNSEHYKLLNETIMALATMPSNQGLANDKALAKAHRMVMAELGGTAPAAAAPATPAKVVQHNVPKPPAPPNIGNLPAASMNDTTGGEFAALDRLGKSGDVEGYEAALDKLTDAQRARYLKD